MKDRLFRIFTDYAFKLENKILYIVHEDIAEDEHPELFQDYEGFAGIKVYEDRTEIYETLDYNGTPAEDSEPIIFKLNEHYINIERVVDVKDNKILTINIL